MAFSEAVRKRCNMCSSVSDSFEDLATSKDANVSCLSVFFSESGNGLSKGLLDGLSLACWKPTSKSSLWVGDLKFSEIRGVVERIIPTVGVVEILICELIGLESEVANLRTWTEYGVVVVIDYESQSDP